MVLQFLRQYSLVKDEAVMESTEITLDGGDKSVEEINRMRYQSRKHKGMQYRQQRNGGKLNGAQDLHDLSSVVPAAKHDQ